MTLWTLIKLRRSMHLGSFFPNKPRERWTLRQTASMSLNAASLNGWRHRGRAVADNWEQLGLFGGGDAVWALDSQMRSNLLDGNSLIYQINADGDARMETEIYVRNDQQNRKWLGSRRQFCHHCGERGLLPNFTLINFILKGHLFFCSYRIINLHKARARTYLECLFLPLLLISCELGSFYDNGIMRRFTQSVLSTN